MEISEKKFILFYILYFRSMSFRFTNDEIPKMLYLWINRHMSLQASIVSCNKFLTMTVVIHIEIDYICLFPGPLKTHYCEKNGQNFVN